MKKISKLFILTLIFTLLLTFASCGASTSEPNTTPQPQNQENIGKRVYFAGPLFSVGERDYNQKITEILESYGYTVFLPQRDGFLATELEGLTEDEKIKKIFDKDCEELLKADIVFVMLDGRVPDEGACIELGIAYASGKRCYGFKSDARSVELDMDLNPMIVGCLKRLFYNLNGDELINDLKAYLNNNTL